MVKRILPKRIRQSRIHSLQWFSNTRTVPRYFLVTLSIAGCILQWHVNSIFHMVKKPADRRILLNDNSHRQSWKLPAVPLSEEKILSEMEGVDKASHQQSQFLPIESTREGESTLSQQHATKEWKVVNILDFGAIGDNVTDNTIAFQEALRVVKDSGGGEVLVPAGGVFQTTPINLTSNVALRVEGVLRGVADQDKFTILPALPSYGRDADFNGKLRRQSLIHSYDADNVTIHGDGIIDGAGWYWYPFFHDNEAAHYIGRPHLIELRNTTNIEITGVTLKDPAFWTLHTVYCQNVHIHHMRIEAPSCRNYRCANTDGIDIDSTENALVEYNTLNVGDDHVTVLAGKARNIYIPPSRNITVQHNVLGSGMGLSIGSSTAGGIEDVLYYNNTMRAERKQMGQGIHIKLRERFGGYVRNIRWIDNTFFVAGKPGGAIVFEGSYQSGNWKRRCTDRNGDLPCPIVSDILIRNLTVHVGNPGRLHCYDNMPCENITLENIHYMDPKAQITCKNVNSGHVKDTDPPELLDPDSCAALYSSSRNTAIQ